MPLNRSVKRLSANWILSSTCGIALLHFGREVIEPLALAIILSLVIAPLVRKVRRLGLGHRAATLVSVALVGACVIGASMGLAIQVGMIAADLPRYKQSIRSKVDHVREITLGPLEKWEANLNGIVPPLSPADFAKQQASSKNLSSEGGQPVPVQIQEPRPTQAGALSRLFALVWGPVGEFAIVLVLLVFILLEHESLRDRLIRLAGETDIARTVQALADTSEGVSHFFFSQFVVNLAFAAVMSFALWLIGLPHAALWGAFGGLLRFVPYVGVPIAAAVTAAFAAAVDPGWSLLFSSLALFVVFELLVANVIEPHVYGHSTGLSPLAVIVSALFWGALWGPVGLLLSTPLTVCLVVAGRHVPALAPFAILLTDTPGVTHGLRFYQRALAAEFDDILQEAHRYLRRYSLAAYCDDILLPGLAFAQADRDAGRIDQKQQERIRATIVNLAESLASVQSGHGTARHRSRLSLASANVGAYLRGLREARLGRWQGSLDVPVGSVVLCAGLASERHEVLNELLVRSLRHAGVDARSVPVGPLQEGPDADKSNLVSTIFVSYPLADEITTWRNACQEFRLRLPHAMLVTIRPPADEFFLDEVRVESEVDLVLHSFAEAVALVSEDRRAKA